MRNKRILEVLCLLVVDVLHLRNAETRKIDAEVVEFVHVIDVTPERINRNAEFIELIPNIFEFLRSLIAPSALMIT